MKNRHALVEAKTGLVRNIIIWEGHALVPPAGHYIIHDCEGSIGDYWHQDSNTFYTCRKKRRVRDQQGRVGEIELTQEEKETIEPRLTEIYDHAQRVFNAQMGLDLTQGDTQVPKE